LLAAIVLPLYRVKTMPTSRAFFFSFFGSFRHPGEFSARL